MEHSYRVQILEGHLDSFGHVNNAVYLQLFEAARWDMMTERGFGLEQIYQLQQGPVILEAHIRYRKELQNRQWITINSKLVPTEKTLIFSIQQEMVRDDNLVAASAEFTGGLMDLRQRKLIPPTEKWLSVFS